MKDHEDDDFQFVEKCDCGKLFCSKEEMKACREGDPWKLFKKHEEVKIRLKNISDIDGTIGYVVDIAEHPEPDPRQSDEAPAKERIYTFTIKVAYYVAGGRKVIINVLYDQVEKTKEEKR